MRPILLTRFHVIVSGQPLWNMPEVKKKVWQASSFPSPNSSQNAEEDEDIDVNLISVMHVACGYMYYDEADDV